LAIRTHVRDRRHSQVIAFKNSFDNRFGIFAPIRRKELIMSDEITIIFFLWRHAEMDSQTYFDYYTYQHLELVASTVSPPPLLHERSFPIDDSVINSATEREGIMSFDSFVAVTFARQADFGEWGTVLADEDKARMLENDEAKFTDVDRRINLRAEVVRSGTMNVSTADAAVHVLRFDASNSALSRSAFKAAHESSFARDGPLPGELGRIRYYPSPDHPLSFARQAWNEDIKASLNMVEHVVFVDLQAAQGGASVMKARRAADDHLGTVTIIHVHQLSALPTGWARR